MIRQVESQFSVNALRKEKRHSCVKLVLIHIGNSDTFKTLRFLWHP